MFALLVDYSTSNGEMSFVRRCASSNSISGPEGEDFLRSFKIDVDSVDEFKKHSLQTYRQRVLRSVALDGTMLQFAPDYIRNDPIIALAAINQNSASLRFASTELRANKEFMYRCVSLDGRVLEFASPELKGDAELAVKAIETYPDAFRFTSKMIRGNPAIAAFAIQSGCNVKYIPRKLRNDRNFILSNSRTLPRLSVSTTCTTRESRNILTLDRRLTVDSGFDYKIFAPGMCSNDWCRPLLGRTEGWGGWCPQISAITLTKHGNDCRVWYGDQDRDIIKRTPPTPSTLLKSLSRC